MGSLGTLAQAEQSDMDVWVCHESGSERKRTHRVAQEMPTAGNLGCQPGRRGALLPDRPRPFRTAVSATRQLSSEDCGTTQHYLLLDEFYRTAIWLAGRTPIWWLVPVYEEANYDRVHPRADCPSASSAPTKPWTWAIWPTSRPGNSSGPGSGSCSRASSRRTNRCSNSC